MWHISRARGFLRTFFHNLALLTTVEYLASDDLEQYSTWNVIQQVFQAEYTLSLHKETLFASIYHGREALFGAIGILLAPQFVVEKEGKRCTVSTLKLNTEWNRVERTSESGNRRLEAVLGGVRHILVLGVSL